MRQRLSRWPRGDSNRSKPSHSRCPQLPAETRKRKQGRPLSAQTEIKKFDFNILKRPLLVSFSLFSYFQYS